MAEFSPKAFARAWLAAWNRCDLEAVLAYYADEVVFHSSLAAEVTGEAEVRGKAALAGYWTEALRRRARPPDFRLVALAWDAGARTLAILYDAHEPGRVVRKCEWIGFGEDGRIVRGEGLTGAARTAA